MSTFHKPPCIPPRLRRGYTMIEVLIALVILAIGIIGMAALIGKMHQAETEAYQRAQALLLLQEMSGRVSIAGLNAVNYVTGSNAPLGTGDAQPASCTGLTYAARDQCAWSNALKGAAEATGGGSVGAMIGARGCVEEVQPINSAPGVCTPGIYRVSVIWQGLTPTISPSAVLGCASGSNYGASTLRRAVSVNIMIGLPTCV